MKVYSLLTQDMVIPELESTTKDDALREMGAFLKKRNKIAKDKDLYEKLLQREELGSTAIGDGVAIPHCKMKGVKNPVVMLAISKKGLDFHSLDGKPSYIFFLVVSSPDNPSVNLQILAAIAHLVRKAKRVIRKIQEAEDISMILEVLKDEEERIDD
ncbi:MAG: PTS sugar transporter subunit IIA [Candidatus Aminicenantaceae bacterium]